MAVPQSEQVAAFDAVPPPSLVEFVADELRRRLLRGQYRPGQRLSEVRVAQELGVTRPPLREAMRLLQKEGLLTSEPRRGTFVTRLTARDIREIYSLRHALENLAIELALPVEDPARFGPLWDAIEGMKRSVRDGDLSALTIQNLRFHRALTALADHHYLQRAYEGIMGQLQMCMAMNLSFRETVYDDPNEVVERHIALLRVFEAGDSEAAKAALEAHGDRSFLAVLDDLLPDPEATTG